jgi:hypothetical protein
MPTFIIVLFQYLNKKLTCQLKDNITKGVHICTTTVPRYYLSFILNDEKTVQLDPQASGAFADKCRV